MRRNGLRIAHAAWCGSCIKWLTFSLNRLGSTCKAVDAGFFFLAPPAPRRRAATGWELLALPVLMAMMLAMSARAKKF